MFGRTMVSALALMGVAHAQEGAAPAAPTQPSSTGCTPEPTCAPPAPTNPSDRTSYDAAYFAHFTPQTALDMVRQAPGFAINNGDQRRGFSGAVGNVLIDGARPIAKSQSLENILSQIPASQVVRIEILRGAAVAGDASGQAVLVNVVRTPNAGSGVWSIGAEENTHRLAPQGNVTWSGRSGVNEYSIGGSYYSQFRSLPGYQLRHDTGTAQITRFVDTPSPRNFREATINTTFARPLFGGRLSTTEQLDAWRFHANNNYHFFDGLQQTTHLEDFLSDYTEHQWSYELGANYDRPIGPWDLTLVGLLNRRYYANNEKDRDDDLIGTNDSTLHQAQNRDSGETILRSTFSRDFSPAHHVEFGIEGAINTLDAKLDLTQDTGGGPVVLTIPNSNVTVEERRAETFVDYTWRPNDRWSVESRLAREQSTLTFTGDTNQTVDLAFIKPSIQVTRNIGEHNQLRLRAYRDVGQLNFDDFVSAASVSDQLINGGNPDLKPETAYRLEFGGELHFNGAALTFALTHHWITDAADVVQIIVPGANPGDPPIRFDAPGNIGDGEANSLTTQLTLPFGHLLPGAQLTFNGTFWQTQVTDPVTGHRRAISGRPDANMDVQFRQDINSRHLAWGFEYQKQTETQVFRFNETDTQEEGPYLDMFVESTAIQGLKVRATLANTLNPAVRRQRFFYTPDRNGTLSSFQERQRRFDYAPWLILSVSGTF